MGSIVVYAIITLWLAVMVLAVAAPFFSSRGASATQKAPAIPLRQARAASNEPRNPQERTAA